MEKTLDVGAVRQEAVLMYYDVTIFQKSHSVLLKFDDVRKAAQMTDLVIEAAPPDTSIQIFARNQPKERSLYDDIN